ncbi:MAG: hypothetical protein KC912_00570 [Proteobacteria bacterium]|nr:hypothetical protein [Pseudomonadota bacterium]
MLLLLLACQGRGEAVALSEAFDVPPPPGARTVEFQLSWEPELGQLVELRRADARLEVDVVDVRAGSPGFVVTAYAPEKQAELALKDSGWSAHR